MPTALSKQEAVDLVSGVRAAFIYGFLLDTAVNETKLIERMRGKAFGFESDNGSEKVAYQLDPVAELLSQSDGARTIKGNYRIILRHSVVRLTYEILIMYAEQTGQLGKVQAEDWYQYARVVRNVLSHKDGAVLHMWPDNLTKRGVSSVSWRGRTISAADVGKHVSLDAYEMVKLHDDMAEFLRLQLS